MPQLRPQWFPPSSSGSGEALIRKLLGEMPKHICAERDGEMARAVYRHYKGGWYEVLHDPAVHAITGETFVIYRRAEDRPPPGVARHTETDAWFMVVVGLNGVITLHPLTDSFTIHLAERMPHLWARHRAMFHGVLPDGRHRFVRRTVSVAEIVEGITLANAHLEKARKHLDSDDPMAASHAAAEIRNAQRVLEQGEPK